ncbi:succinylglutamate desuccinylase [Colwellia chukchiensis]|uniref:Succinylglutamate desuccinylase n=1 Tax=Colwellia chukchiensis TaxID=641665 RepID=A0A1H7RVU2_9GAMM|nr:succinylglutamate desuccinylase [Colwellia chukchiensis]SEL64285.1 succinylglutamate desuccinylase [Colwellia chukchiensis]
MNDIANSSTSLATTLQQSADFLAMTRAHEWSLPSGGFSFEVSHQESNTSSKVRVLDTGLITFEPINRATSKDIILSSAVHGNETAPIEICNDIIAQLIRGELMLAERVLFIFGNPAAMNIAQRFVEENMNRLFSGGHSQDQGQGAGLINKERHRALLLENTVRDFYLAGAKLSSANGQERQRCHYDLHTAIRGSKCDKFAVYPFLHGAPRKKSQLQFLNACGVNTILLSHSPTTTFSYFSSNEFGADAFTVELGKVRAFGENDMSQFVQVRETLTRLVSGQDLGLVPYQEQDFNLYEISQVIDRHHEEFSLTFADDVENFTDFPKGHVLAIDGDIEVKTQQDGEAIIFPNANVAIGQRALLTVVPTRLS